MNNKSIIRGMNIMKVICFSQFMFYFSPALLAAGYTGTSEITGFSSMDSNGTFEIYGTWKNIDNCRDTRRYNVGQHAMDNGISQESKYKIVMAAYLNNKTVELYLDGCNIANEPIVREVFLPAKYGKTR
jgi:hypothetical protein